MYLRERIERERERERKQRERWKQGWKDGNSPDQQEKKRKRECSIWIYIYMFCTYSHFSVDIHTVSSTNASYWSVMEMAGTVSTVTISVSAALKDSMRVSRVVWTETRDTWARVSEVVTTHRCCMLMSELLPLPDR